MFRNLLIQSPPQHIHENDITYQFLRPASSTGIPALRKSRSLAKHGSLPPQLHAEVSHWNGLPLKTPTFPAEFYSLD